MFSFKYFLFYLSLGSHYYYNDRSYLVYFIVVPREASNLSEVKIWGCCCPKTVFGAAP
jgi:hypothetical protein